MNTTYMSVTNVPNFQVMFYMDFRLVLTEMIEYNPIYVVVGVYIKMELQQIKLTAYPQKKLTLKQQTMIRDLTIPAKVRTQEHQLRRVPRL